MRVLVEGCELRCLGLVFFVGGRGGRGKGLVRVGRWVGRDLVFWGG